MKYVEWVEPYGGDSCIPVICRMRLPDIVRVQIEKNPLYGSFAERAIEDFIAVYWARIVEYDY